MVGILIFRVNTSNVKPQLSSPNVSDVRWIGLSSTGKHWYKTPNLCTCDEIPQQHNVVLCIERAISVLTNVIGMPQQQHDMTPVAKRTGGHIMKALYHSISHGGYNLYHVYYYWIVLILNISECRIYMLHIYRLNIWGLDGVVPSTEMV